MKVLTSLCLVLCLNCPIAVAEETEEEWIQLFNGKDLEGWTPKIRGYELGENPSDTFRVVDGLLTISYDGYKDYDKRFGHLFYEKPFSNYRIRAEYRFIGDQCPGGEGWATRNNGLMLHGEDPAGMELDQEFPASIEVQLLGGLGNGERSTANLCTPGTNVVMNGRLHRPHCMNSTSKTYDGDQWVTVEVEVRGNEVIRHFVNGEQVMEYTEPQLDDRDAHSQGLIEQAGGEIQLDRGTISIQSESHPTQFRKIEVLVLDDASDSGEE